MHKKWRLCQLRGSHERSYRQPTKLLIITTVTFAVSVL